MAPDSAALLVGFLNTLHLPDGVDVLAGSGPQEWIADGSVDRGRSALPDVAGASIRQVASVEDLRTVREGLRVLTRRDMAIDKHQRMTLRRADRALRDAPLVLRLPDDGVAVPHLSPIHTRSRSTHRQLAAIVDAYVRSTADQTFGRVKTCAVPDCQWAFYDTSRNHSRRWCTMDGCGNRVKNRSYRARRATRR